MLDDAKFFMIVALTAPWPEGAQHNHFPTAQSCGYDQDGSS